MNKKFFNFVNIFDRFKGLFSIGISDILGGVISSLFWLYVATLLEVNVYGEIFYIFAIGNLVSTFALIGSKNTLHVYVPKQIKLDSAIFSLVLLIASVISLAVFFINPESFLGLYIFGTIIFGLGLSEVLAKKFYTNYFVLLLSQKLLMIGFSIGLFHLIGTSGILLGTSLSFFVYLVIIIKEFKNTKIDFSLLTPRFKFLFESYGQSIFSSLWSQLDKLMIAPLLGFTLLGNYQLGIQFIAVFQLIPFIVLKYTLPHDASDNPNRNLKILTVLFSIFSTVLIILISPIIIPLFFEKFVYVVDIIQILSLSLIPFSINTAVYSSKILASEKSRIFMIGSIITVSVYAIGIVLFGEIIGIHGVAISYVLGMSVLTVYYFIIDFKKLILK
jgi:O-antigen/teichoic acid export membrane protein